AGTGRSSPRRRPSSRARRCVMASWTAEARQFLEAHRVGHLATAGPDGAPHVIPVCYALDDVALYFVADEKPKRRPARELLRLRNLRANPRAALVVDDYDEDWTRLAYVLVRGPARVVDEAAHPAALRLAQRSVRRARPERKLAEMKGTAQRPGRRVCAAPRHGAPGVPRRASRRTMAPVSLSRPARGLDIMIIDRETFTELAVHLKLASDAILKTARHLAVLSNADSRTAEL